MNTLDASVKAIIADVAARHPGVWSYEATCEPAGRGMNSFRVVLSIGDEHYTFRIEADAGDSNDDEAMDRVYESIRARAESFLAWQASRQDRPNQ